MFCNSCGGALIDMWYSLCERCDPDGNSYNADNGWEECEYRDDDLEDGYHFIESFYYPTTNKITGEKLTMEQQEKQYLLTRINTIRHQKIAEAGQKYMPPVPVGSNLTATQKTQRLKEGKFKVRDQQLAGYGNDIYSFIDFSVTPNAKPDPDKYNAVCKKINKEADALSDEVMLGQCNEALTLLKKLSEMEV